MFSKRFKKTKKPTSLNQQGLETQRPNGSLLVFFIRKTTDRMSHIHHLHRTLPSPQAAKMRGVSFDLFHNVGCIFTSLASLFRRFAGVGPKKNMQKPRVNKSKTTKNTQKKTKKNQSVFYTEKKKKKKKTFFEVLGRRSSALLLDDRGEIPRGLCQALVRLKSFFFKRRKGGKKP